MKEDILKFRKTCDVLIDDKGYNKNKISIESKLTWPTLKKVLEDPVDDIKIKASILGLVQDFNKKHLDDVSYAGIKPIANSVEIRATDLVATIGKEIKRKNIASSRAPRNDRSKEENITGIQPKTTDDFIKFMRKLTAECPSNLKIKITING